MRCTNIFLAALNPSSIPDNAVLVYVLDYTIEGLDSLFSVSVQGHYTVYVLVYV